MSTPEDMMDRGASSATKTQDLADGVYEDAHSEISRGGFIGTKSESTLATQSSTEKSTQEEKPGEADREFGDDGSGRPAGAVQDNDQSAATKISSVLGGQ